MPLPISTAKATKGTMMNNYGSKKTAGKKAAGKKAAAKKPAAKGKKGLPPALAKKAAEMKAKGKKAPAKGAKPAFLKKKSAKK